MKENNNDIINDNNFEKLQNQEPNNQHQLEILACDETLQDFEKYLLDRGLDEMIECVVSKNKNERKNFSYFFKYFGMDTDINSQNKAESNILFILKLKHILTTLNKEKDKDKKQQLLAIIAVALQNCKLRESFFPECGDDKKIGDNLLSLLSQAQYFLRLAKKCKVSFSSRNVCSDDFLKTGYKEIDVIDSNNFLYCKPHMMPLVSRKKIEDEIKKILIQPFCDQLQQLQRNYNAQLQKLNADGETASKQGTDIINRQNKLKQNFEKNKQYILSCINNIQNKDIDEATFNTYRNGVISIIVNQNNEFVKQHFKKISTAIVDFAKTKPQNAKTEIIVPTSYHWGPKQNSFITEQYIQNINKINNNDISLTINAPMQHLVQIYKNKYIKKNNNISIYDKSKDTLFEFKDENTISLSIPNTFPNNAIYINSGDHLVFPSNEGHIGCRNQLNANDNTEVDYQSTDVAMINTEFFKFLGADGQLTNGIFTFNNEENAEQNFQSLNMPNIFTFKDKNIDAIKFVSELCNSISKEKQTYLTQIADQFCEAYVPKQLSQPETHWYDPRTWCSCINGANDSLEQEPKKHI